MKRIAAIVLLVIALPALLVFAVGAKDPTQSSGGYKVRAIFDNAGNATQGEDVKVAGAIVGLVEKMDVTDDKKAAVTLKITEPGFAPFHKDAKCSIRPQGLIGEKFVECSTGSNGQPELAKVPDGQKGAGEHLLPVESNSSPVDLDLVNSVLRLPYRQRLAIILNEFGTATAGRGQTLNEAIHRANPALRDTDRVLAIIAQQNRTLGQLAADSDTILQPLAAKRQRVSDFIVKSNETAQATAARSADIERTFQRFPHFLRELKPTLADLGSLSRQMTPVVTDLHSAAPDLNRFITQLGPFSRAGTPALQSLGDAADVGRPALNRSRPLITDLARFAKTANPVGKQLVALTTSLDKTGGIERFADYLFYQATAINGFDGISHYLRAGFITNTCSVYTVEPANGCSSNFGETKTLGKKVASQSALGPQLADTPKGTGAAAPGGTNPFETLRQLADPKIASLRRRTINTARGGGRNVSPAFGQQNATDAALDYLLGSDSK
jgi:phospholipid/cholesterol/gamma-HCH transport system substrate-binding protein